MRNGKEANIIWVGLCLIICCCQQPDKSYPLVNVPVEGANFYQVGLAQIESNIQTDPDNPDVYFKKALYLQALDQIDEALSAVKQAISLDPTPVYLIKEAELLLIKQQYATALSRISRAQILGGDFPDMWHLMAKLNFLEGKYREALSAVNQALQKYPSGISYFCTKGKIEWALKDTLNAYSSFLKSVEAAESKSESLSYLAVISRAKGDFPQAFTYLDLNLEDNPTDSKLLIEKGQLLSETAQYDSALVIFHLLKKSDSTDYQPYYESALVHYQVRRYDSALFYTDKSLELQKNHLPSMLIQARIFDRRRYYGTAIKKYREIVAIDSTYTPAVEELVKLQGKIAYLQKIQRDREENAQVETINPTKSPIKKLNEQ